MLRSFIGPPLLASFESLLGSERAADALSLYRERFGDIGWQENRPYDGIRELLESLTAKDRTLYVATSKPQVFAQKIVEHFGLRDYFSTVFGAELDGRNADKVELLEFALSESGATDAVMVGDRKHDVIGALENGLSVIGVTWGYGSEEELRAAGADQIVASPGALGEMLAG